MNFYKKIRLRDLYKFYSTNTVSISELEKKNIINGIDGGSVSSFSGNRYHVFSNQIYANPISRYQINIIDYVLVIDCVNFSLDLRLCRNLDEWFCFYYSRVITPPNFSGGDSLLLTINVIK